jgi:hypothetical protein
MAKRIAPAVCTTKPHLLDKAKFYEALKPFANKHLGILFNLRFGGHYELIFDWSHRKPNGDFNPIMYAQLVDLRISGSKKYVVPDLFLDVTRDDVGTDFRLYKALDKWVTDALLSRPPKEGNKDGTD